MKYKSVDDMPDWFQEEFDEQELIIEDLLQKNENLARTINKNKDTIHNLQLQVTSLTKQHEQDLKKLNSSKFERNQVEGKMKHMKLWCEIECKRQVSQMQQVFEKKLVENQLEFQQISQTLLSERDAHHSTRQELVFFQNQSSYLLSQIKQLIEEKIKVETENFGLHAEIEWMVGRAQGLDTLKVEVSPLENNLLEATQVNQA